MMESWAGLIIDVLILVLLSATVFYAIMLSRHLKNFRDGRADLEKLIARLVDGIARAEGTLAALRDAADDAGKDLQSRINKARALSDELQIMTEAADNLAERLEQTASRRKSSTKKKVDIQPSIDRESAGSFDIQDREFSSQEEGMDSQSIDDGADDDSAFLSRAERELYQALKVKRRGRVE